MSLQHQQAKQHASASESAPGLSSPSNKNKGSGNQAKAEDVAARSKGGAAPRGIAGVMAQMQRSAACMGVDLDDYDVEFGKKSTLDDIGAEASYSKKKLQFASSSPDPETIAHELAHAKQAEDHGASGGSALSEPEEASEKEADAVAKKVVKGQKAKVHRGVGKGVMRKKKKNVFAKTDQYNKKNIKGNSGNSGNRPSAIADQGEASAVRVATTTTFYAIEDGVAVKSGAAHLQEGKGVFVNPSPPTLAKLPDNLTDKDGKAEDAGKQVHFVMVWQKDLGGGWVPLKYLKDGDPKDGKKLTASRIAGEARRKNKAWGGAKPGGGTHAYTFKSKMDNSLGDHGKYVMPGQKKGGKGNLTDHHMERHRSATEKETKAEAAAKKAADDKAKTDPNASTNEDFAIARAYYNVFMNLPGKNTAAVAVDIGKPGDTFEVYLNGKSPMSRAVPTYDHREGGNSKRRKGLIFYYGYRKGQPDKRGWVLRECVEKAQTTVETKAETPAETPAAGTTTDGGK